MGDTSYCEIGEDTIIREHVTIHRGASLGSSTRIGRRCYLMANSYVGHDCWIGDDVTLVNGSLLTGHVEIGSRAVISVNATVHEFARIGEGAMIGGLSKITQDVVPYFMANGNGQIVGINRIGLSRTEVASAEVDLVQRAYRILCRKGDSLSVARQHLAALPLNPLISTIIAFVSVDSRRGFHL